jgi:hypothetical protein
VKIQAPVDFYGPGKGSMFSTQASNLNVDRNAKDNFGKV